MTIARRPRPIRRARPAGTARRALVLAGLALLATLRPAPASAQELRVGDLTIDGSAVPQRLMGYGLVVGLDGTGDRPVMARQSGMTVQSVVNLLRRFDLAVPAEMLRTQNVAAVLVTAEVSPYLRPGGRFIVHVSALGDARSLRGGVLWTTPLVAEAGGPALATAQGPLLIDDPATPAGTLAVRWRPRTASPVNHAAIPDGGVLEGDLPKPAVAFGTRLLLRQPDLGTASRITAAVNAALGAGSAKMEDPGAITLSLKGNAEEQLDALGRLRDLPVRPSQPSAIFVDARSGLVIAGGDVPVGAATVRHTRFSLVVSGTGANAGPVRADSTARTDSTAAARVVTIAPDTTARPADRTAIPLRLPVGSSVLEVAAALRAVDAQPGEVAAVLLALRQVGALTAEVVVR